MSGAKARKKATAEGPRPEDHPNVAAAVKLSKEQRQKVKLLLQRPAERLLVDKVLEDALDAGRLHGDDADVANALLARSRARRW